MNQCKYGGVRTNPQQPISIVTIVQRFVIESFHLLEMLAEFYFKKENKTAF